MKLCLVPVVLACAACGDSASVLIATSWEGGRAEALETETVVDGQPPERATLPGPIDSPFRLLVGTLGERSLKVTVGARRGGQVVARGTLGAKPAARQVLELALTLQPVPGSRCGDGVADAGEACDDGNREDRDGCTNACTCAACGDGVLQSFGLVAPGGVCPTYASESCDDGNTTSGDGCSAACERE